jgi:hypothetical protein
MLLIWRFQRQRYPFGSNWLWSLARKVRGPAATSRRAEARPRSPPRHRNIIQVCRTQGCTRTATRSGRLSLRHHMQRRVCTNQAIMLLMTCGISDAHRKPWFGTTFWKIAAQQPHRCRSQLQPISHCPLWISNLTEPSSRIFSKSDRHDSSFGTFVHFMMS